jgi:hypothetical protein
LTTQIIASLTAGAAAAADGAGRVIAI